LFDRLKNIFKIFVIFWAIGNIILSPFNFRLTHDEGESIIIEHMFVFGGGQLVVRGSVLKKIVARHWKKGYHQPRRSVGSFEGDKFEIAKTYEELRQDNAAEDIYQKIRAILES
jgi:hypothetical protein